MRREKFKVILLSPKSASSSYRPVKNFQSGLEMAMGESGGLFGFLAIADEVASEEAGDSTWACAVNDKKVAARKTGN